MTGPVDPTVLCPLLYNCAVKQVPWFDAVFLWHLMLADHTLFKSLDSSAGLSNGSSTLSPIPEHGLIPVLIQWEMNLYSFKGARLLS